MGKKNAKKKAAEKRRTTMRVGAMALACLVGVALLAGMAMFNRGVKPDRDMQWYVRDGALEVAGSELGDGFDDEFLVPEENMRPSLAPTPEPTPEPEPAEAPTQDNFMPDMSNLPADGTAETGTEDVTEDGFDAPEMADEAEDEEECDLPDDGPTAAPGEEDFIPEDGADVPDEAIFPETQEAEPEAEQDPDGVVTLTITAVGDCTFGGMEGAKSHPRFAKLLKENGYDYFFDGVRDIFKGDDLTIVNLEGPLTSETKRHSSGFVFKADPSCVKILSGSSVELCNLANNHTMDYGIKGIKETATLLDTNGIGFCGYDVAYEKTIKGIRVCGLGFTCWERSYQDAAKLVAEHRPNCDLLIVSMHWGDEHVYDYNPKQAEAAHALIDAGADLVIGTHPHVMQGIEKYKGKYILYSLGNFSFAGNANPEDKRCLIFQQKFSFVPGMNMAYAGCADAGINLIPASVTSTAGKNDFRPMVLPAEEGAKALKFLARISKNFNMKDTLWMRNNYMLANGLMKTREEQEAEARAKAAEADENVANAAVTDETPADDEEEAAAAPPLSEDADDPGDAAPADEEEADAPLLFDDEDAGSFTGAEATPEPEEDEPAPFFSRRSGGAA